MPLPERFYPTHDTCPQLLSFEQRMLAHFILQSKETREDLLHAAAKDPHVSGSLIQAYRWALTA